MAKPMTEYQKRMRWFHKARFGMFIHWGLYAVPGNGEWWMYTNRIPRDEYEKLADQFNPTKFDADAWAGLAAEAGMKYMVLTSRHHDGFCLYDSQVSDFTSVKRRARRDFVDEYTKACRKAGLKVGLYYSLLDWRFPGFFERGKHLESSEAMAQQFRDQVRELMTQYGKIDVLWYDGGWPGTEMKHFDFDDMSEMYKYWGSKKVNAMARKLQPGIIINNRSGVDEDIDTPEHYVEASKRGRGWESCGTIGDMCGWGYVKHNPNWSTVPSLLQTLVTCAAGQGNYLLNVGPSPAGVIRREEAVRLRAMGDWLKGHGEAIYDSEPCELSGGMIGMWSRRGTTGYLHVFRWPGEEAQVPLVATRARSATVLATGKRVKLEQASNGRLIFKGLPAKPPHPALNVIKVKFDGIPKAMKEKDRAAWLCGKA